ncbi:MAG: 3'(2'),5'-bisphosphate nucleotidase CysQ [Rhizobiaceae bacterium]
MTDDFDHSDDLALLKHAAAEAGRIAMGYFRKDPKISWKAGMSPVTEADLHVDRYLQAALMAARPHYGWLSEETEDDQSRLGKLRTFVVDPIDGTKAFIEGRDIWCVSIAVVENGRTLSGVLDCPARTEVFESAKGSGSYLNGRLLAMAEPQAPLRVAGPKQFVTPFAGSVNRTVEMVGHVPSLAYRIAAIACGQFDATFIKPDAHDWDLAAADLILAEAGGTLVNASGDRPAYAGAAVAHGVLVAGHDDLIAPMLGVVAQTAIG